MAAPHVSGLAAVILSADATATGAVVADRIISTADDAGATGFDTSYGFGIIDPWHAVTGLGG